MFKCHLCNLETKQLNGLLTNHYKKHLSEHYTKEQYKVDALNSNGRPQPLCPYCNLSTRIPSGTKEYPKYHKQCYLKNITGEKNPNWNGGKITAICEYCSKSIIKHGSQLQGDKRFCSTPCAMQFYALPENRTEIQKQTDQYCKKILQDWQKSDICRNACARARAKMQSEHTSKVEKRFLQSVQMTHPDALGSQQLDFYVVDTLVPSINEIFEVQGNYWHNQPVTRGKDKRKRLFFKNNRPQYKFYTIWENEINDLPHQLLEHAKLPVNLIILGGPSGCGKSYLGQQVADYFEIIDYDKHTLRECIELCHKPTEKIKLLITPMRVKCISTQLRRQGIRNWCVYLREDIEVIKERIKARNGKITPTLQNRIDRYESLKDKIFQYYGTQEEVKSWLSKILD